MVLIGEQLELEQAFSGKNLYGFTVSKHLTWQELAAVHEFPTSTLVLVNYRDPAFQDHAHYFCLLAELYRMDEDIDLEINNLKDRALETLRYMNMEIQKLSLRNDIQSKVQSDINQQQREYLECLAVLKRHFPRVISYHSCFALRA